MADSCARREHRRKGALSVGRGRLPLVRDLVTLLGAFYLPAAIVEVAGDGTATFANGRSIDSDAVDVYTVFAADLDGDGDLDVLAALNDEDTVVWYENVDGMGSFPVRYDVSRCCDRGAPSSISVGDLNGDGSSDVVVSYEIASLTWFRNSDGLGDFSGGIDIADAEGPTWVDLADIDGDGDLDVVSTSFSDGRITWYENTDGEGTFSVGVDITTTADGPNFVLTADLDSDGDLDVVSTAYPGDLVTWYENTSGEGEFSTGINLSDLFFTPRYLAAADLDGDLDLDIVSVGDVGDITWFENTDGAGAFAEGQDIDALESAASVVAVDLDNDGDIDLVVADTEGGRIVWYENTDGLATFSAPIEIALDFGVREVIAADVDGDGDIDLVSASPDQARIILYENLLITAATITTSESDDFAESTPVEVTPAPQSPSVAPTPEEKVSTPTPSIATSAPSVPQPTANISEDSIVNTTAPSGTLAPGMVMPLVESGSATGENEYSDSRWLNAAWEIAVAVIGGVLVATISAIVVALIVKREPEESSSPSRSDSAVFNVRNRDEGNADVD